MIYDVRGEMELTRKVELGEMIIIIIWSVKAQEIGVWLMFES